MAQEVFKAIPAFPGYQASNLGRIRGKKGKILRPRLEENDVVVAPCVDGRQASKSIGHLVLRAFAGPPGPLQECRHLNDNRWDNRYPENLAWGTHAENIQDAIRNGRILTKFKDAQVLELRQRAQRWRRGTRADEMQRLAAAYGVGVSTIADMLNRKTYKWCRQRLQRRDALCQ